MRLIQHQKTHCQVKKTVSIEAERFVSVDPYAKHITYFAGE
jgi:hypothetical protein